MNLCYMNYVNCICFWLMVLAKHALSTEMDSLHLPNYNILNTKHDRIPAANESDGIKVDGINVNGINVATHSRHKRQLLYPVDTVLQCTFAVVSPIQLKEYNMFVNHGFQLNFALPNRLSQLPATFLFGPPVIDVARSRNRRDEGYWNEIVEKDRGSEKIPYSDITTEELYLYIEAYLASTGVNGTSCLLHSICQLAYTPLHQDDDLLHEIVHFILTPSEHGETITDSKTDKYNLLVNPTPLQEYLEAEEIGREGENCDDFFYSCPRSPLDRISIVKYFNGDDNYVEI